MNLTIAGVAAALGVSELERVGGSASGHYYRVAPDLLLAMPRDDYSQSGALARGSLAEFDRIANEAGRRQGLVVLVDRVLGQDSESRRVWSVARAEETRACQALVCTNLLARAIGSFFLGINRGPIPTAMFPDLPSALAWATRTLELTGGPLR